MKSVNSFSNNKAKKINKKIRAEKTKTEIIEEVK
jgi:hypothetical protein